MLNDIRELRGVRHAVVLSSDGLYKTATEHTDRDTADTVAAACSALASLGQGMARRFGRSDTIRQVVVEFDGGFLFVRDAADGSRLAVVTEATIDPGLIAHQMQAQVTKIGEAALATPPRS
ncbi:roadblock/LC7 domain-containing protein [Saccharopolyspora shandongensis]|uniref:roadblock/LC7 domain-containing protein n=1 Tax=Saccharopolyspora shandongensis TaxID=418495 RepID=UPI0033FB3582